jgi:hypothetical protein
MRDTASNHRSARKLATQLAAILLAGAALAPAMPALAASSVAAPGAIQTRTLAWSGGDRLSVAVGAQVDYVPGSDAKVVITGPADQIEDIVVDDGVIRHQGATTWRWLGWWGNSRDWGGQPIRIVVTAPHLSAAHVGGSGQLNLGRLTQDRLDLGVSGSGGAMVSGAIRSLSVSVSGSGRAKVPALTAGDVAANLSGSGSVTVAGTAESLRLHVSGSGRADMAGLALMDAVAGLSGSGSASMAPKRSAELQVSGAGSIRLMANPTQLSAHRSGSGRIIRLDGSDAAPRRS